jgi:hypothetical protein
LYFVVGIILRGWVLSILWAWFIATQFGIQEIQIVHAIGLSLIITYLTKTPSTSVNFRDVDMYIGIIILPFIVLGMGWIVKLFM